MLTFDEKHKQGIKSMGSNMIRILNNVQSSAFENVERKAYGRKAIGFANCSEVRLITISV